MKNELKPNKTDFAVNIVGGIVGLAPYAGGLLQELIHDIVPNQRIDRIAKFVESLDNELHSINADLEKIKETLLNNQCYGAYFTKCLKIVSDEIYEEKINYYKKMCIKALTSDEKELMRLERIMNIIEQMDYYEIQYLRFYYNPSLARSEMQQDAIDKIGYEILVPTYSISMNEEAVINETSKQITINNLIKNGLLEEKINVRTGRKKYEITTLGRVILKEISDEDIKVY